jgi:dTDP-glucose 4,6-dehydratase
MDSFSFDFKTILVTGGYGFIMSNLINIINDTYYNTHIINVDKCGAGSNKSNISRMQNHNHITNVKMKCEDPDFKNLLVKYKPDVIIHGAAESHVDRSITDPLGFVTSNVVGTANVVNSIDWYQKNIKNHCKCVLVSTDEVYGHLEVNENPWTEDSPIAPRSPYASSKAAADLIALSFHNTFKTDFCIVRGCNNFGPRQDEEKLLPKYITGLFRGDVMPVYGNGKNIREWVFVEDFCYFILDRAINYAPGKVFNYGKGVSRNNLEILDEVYETVKFFCRKKDCELIRKYAKFEDTITFVEDRKGHDFKYAMRSKYLHPDLPSKSFKKQLYSTVEFYYEKTKAEQRAANSWYRKLFK